MTTVCIFAPDLHHELETIGFYFRLSGADVVFATQPNGNERSEHPWCLQRLRQTQNLRWISDEPSRIDLLISEAFIEPQYAAQRANWGTQANELAVLFPHRGMTLKRRVGYLWRSWPHSVTAKTAIFFGDRRQSLDTLPPAFQKRTFYAPYIHPQLFADEALSQIFADFCVMDCRRHPIGFMGNKNPRERSIALAECRRAIDHAGAQSFWIEYGDDEHHNALTPEQFISALGQMDFCLCPAGWSGWTHRVVESLCRGAIPILPDPHLYGLGLRDSVNCISVKGGNWYGSVKNALSMPVHKLQEMRRNVLDLRDTLLMPSAASRRFCRQFLIAPYGTTP
jgi:hypothetical protein